MVCLAVHSEWKRMSISIRKESGKCRRPTGACKPFSLGLIVYPPRRDVVTLPPPTGWLMTKIGEKTAGGPGMRSPDDKMEREGMGSDV